MKEAPSHEKAYVDSMQIFPIYCGENIKLYREYNMYMSAQSLYLLELSRRQPMARSTERVDHGSPHLEAYRGYCWARP